ncbi:MAG: hypothetical protein JW839_05720 [Candidatus Lokiarchaeota archaeon]|nr:hypothetical protein [Candidatus Lokiarchaeota archaeon]
MRKFIENDVPGLKAKASFELVAVHGQAPSIDVDGKPLVIDVKNYKKLKKAVEERLK